MKLNILISVIAVSIVLCVAAEEPVPVPADDIVAEVAVAEITAAASEEADPAIRKAKGQIETEADKEKEAQDRFGTYVEGFAPPIEDDSAADQLKKLAEELSDLAGDVDEGKAVEIIKSTKAKTAVKKDEGSDKKSVVVPVVQDGVSEDVSIASSTVNKLKKCAMDAIVAPDLLAESLFKGKSPQAALTFYNKCHDEAKEDEDKSWFMYQMANCVRKSDPARALQLYEQVAIQYKTTTWAVVAANQKQLLEWLIKEKPEDLIKEIEQQSKIYNRVMTPKPELSEEKGK